MKYIWMLVLAFSVHAHSVEGSSILQSALDEVARQNWDASKKKLDSYTTKNDEYYLVSSLWLGAKENPDYDKNASIESLYNAYLLGSRDAQLMLIGVYLFSEEFPHANYYKGMELAQDLLVYYENEISQGKDPDGELSRIVGKFYLLGIGSEKDVDKGTSLVKRAAKLGDAEAKEMLDD